MSIDLGSIRTRVNASGLFRSVSDASALTNAMANPGSQLPAAFVLMPEETAEPNKLIGIHRQRVRSRISITFVLLAQKAAGDRSDEIEGIRTVMREYIGGFMPTGAADKLDYVASRITSDQRGFVWVTMMFDCSYLFEGTDTLPTP